MSQFILVFIYVCVCVWKSVQSNTIMRFSHTKCVEIRMYFRLAFSPKKEEEEKTSPSQTMYFLRKHMYYIRMNAGFRPSVVSQKGAHFLQKFNFIFSKELKIWEKYSKYFKTLVSKLLILVSFSSVAIESKNMSYSCKPWYISVAN